MALRFSTGHIGICVPDVDAACKFFEEKNVKFVKKPDEGNVRILFEISYLFK